MPEFSYQAKRDTASQPDAPAQRKSRAALQDNRFGAIAPFGTATQLRQGAGQLRSMAIPPAGILQAVWADTSAHGATVAWDELIDGVRWYANAEGEMWFLIEDVSAVKQGKVGDYREQEGPAHKKSWVAWNKRSIHPAPQFTADVDGDYGLGFNDDRGDPNWRKWDSYTRIAIGSAMTADRQANVRRNEHFDGGGLGKSALDYIARFKIVTRHEYNIKLWEMAEVLAKLGRYTCVVSEAGKSNFWVTARVLKKVQMLGGNAPVRIISVPAKEKGEMDALQSISVDLAGAGDIVFLDDGSYSGSQLAKFIAKVMRDARNQVHYGLVAMSEMAEKVIGDTAPSARKLINPIPIEQYEDGTGLNTDQDRAGLPVKSHSTDGTPPDGNYLHGLYYKVPDYASVRDKLLTKVEGSNGGAAVTGYSRGRGGFDFSSMQPVTVGATEPYKAPLGRDMGSLGLEQVTPTAKRFGLDRPARVPDAARSSSPVRDSFLHPRTSRDPRHTQKLRRGMESIVETGMHLESSSPATSSKKQIMTTDPESLLLPDDARLVLTAEPSGQIVKGKKGETYSFVKNTADGEFFLELIKPEDPPH